MAVGQSWRHFFGVDPPAGDRVFVAETYRVTSIDGDRVTVSIALAGDDPDRESSGAIEFDARRGRVVSVERRLRIGDYRRTESVRALGR